MMHHLAQRVLDTLGLDIDYDEFGPEIVMEFHFVSRVSRPPFT